ncbi:MAG: carboxypeptidase regulatory-like domain-containing protein [Acidobacteria bacterium]|nr:carboxypeptidase regulatory-like domain-containing protein [Acidobacteriota bacterium]
MEPARFSGILAGRVVDTVGVPQMGAVVMLYNRYDRFVTKLVTCERGLFAFDSLTPNQYSIRVTLSSFIPAVRRNIAIQSGLRSFLTINLSSMLSSIELVHLSPGQVPVMSEEWKWVLRSGTGTRPALRMLPGGGVDISDPSRPVARASNVFSGTRGVVALSSGEGGPLSSAGSQADLGTSFALATSVYGANRVSVSGNVGYASHSGTPTAGFATSYARDTNTGPQVNVIMRQMFLPARISAALASGRNDSMPALQSLSVAFIDRVQIHDSLQLEYGSSLESVSFVDRLNYASPFARVRWGSAESGAVEFAFSSGTPAVKLLNPGELNGTELKHQLNTLSLFPRVSVRDGHAHVQRAQNFELGYRKEAVGRKFAASAWREDVSNAAFNAKGPAGALEGSELLPDLSSNLAVVNGGSYRRMGYEATVTQNLGESHRAMIGYGYSGALTMLAAGLPVASAAEMRSALRTTGQHSLTARMSGTAPATKTRYAASYRITDYSKLNPVHLPLTQRTTLEPGLNLYLRQPIPGAGLLSGRLEASAEWRNLLGQGYLPLATPGGHRLLLIQTPRALRGGVSLIF